MNKVYPGTFIALLALHLAGCNPPASTQLPQSTASSRSTVSEWQQTEARIESATELGDAMYAYSLSYPATASTAVNEAGEPVVGPIVQNVFGLTYLPKTGQTLTIEYRTDEPLLYRIVQPWGNTDQTTAVAGVYTWGHEVEAFTPCNLDRDYWIIGQAEVLNPLKEASLAKSEQLKKPYQGVYAEIRLALLPAAEDGFAADYDGVVQALKVKTWANAIPENCVTKASGSSSPANPVIDDHSSRNSLDRDGFYYGSIPCASCPQIDRWLELKQQGESTRVKLVDIYRGNDELVTELSASAEWTEDGGSIVIPDNNSKPLRFLVGESALMQYAEGEAPSAQYRLDKMRRYSDDKMAVFTAGLRGKSEFELVANYTTQHQTETKSARIQVKVNCSQGTYTTIKTTGYSGLFASGSVVQKMDTNPDINSVTHPLTDKTALAMAASEACD
ncbi:MAG: hypothetical protein CSA52_00070 [Gammaproteobacteria bacterium]|nr:MAG: hypothetical protein CSA52_00070 [Gammaproteobacteria bacterium]